MKNIYDYDKRTKLAHVKSKEQSTLSSPNKDQYEVN